MKIDIQERIFACNDHSLVLYTKLELAHQMRYKREFATARSLYKEILSKGIK